MKTKYKRSLAYKGVGVSLGMTLGLVLDFIIGGTASSIATFGIVGAIVGFFIGKAVDEKLKTMIIIGITGATGSGKSEFARLLNLPVIDADLSARKAVQDKKVISKLQKVFGKDIVDENGALIRPVLAQKAFATPEQTEKLNAITHPFIIKDMLSDAKEFEKKGEKAVIFDAPLLFEAGLEVYCYTVVGVIADESTRLNRIITRDGITEEQARQRLSAAKPDEFFINRCDKIIVNDGDFENLKTKADEFLKEIL